MLNIEKKMAVKLVLKELMAIDFYHKGIVFLRYTMLCIGVRLAT